MGHEFKEHLSNFSFPKITLAPSTLAPSLVLHKAKEDGQ